jgi:hypothetical protein
LSTLASSLSERARNHIVETKSGVSTALDMVFDESIEQDLSSHNAIFVNYMFSEVGKICSEGLARRGR